MIIEHGGKKPKIDKSAVVAPSATISGDVRIGAETCVLAGAVLTSEGTPLKIGPRSIIMENVVIRASKVHPTTIGHHVFIGPQVHISGAFVSPRCFISTGAILFNGAMLEEGCLLAVHSVVHMNTTCKASTFIPAGFTLYGKPARLYNPADALELHRKIASKGFTKTVFGFDSSEMSIPLSVETLCERYLKSLLTHSDDREIG